MALRSRHLFAFDLVAVLTAYALSFVMRFDTGYIWPQLSQYWPVVVPLALLKLALLYRFGLYRRVWRYASLPEIVGLINAVSLASIAVGLLVLWGSTPNGPEIVQGFPRSVIAIDWLVTVALIGGSRLTARVLDEAQRHRRGPRLDGWPTREKRVLVVGAGDAGAMIVREMQGKPELGLKPVGFVDDDAHKHGLAIRGVKVLGGRDQLAALVGESNVDEVIIAMPTAPGRVIRDIAARCRAVGVEFKTIPGIFELLDGRVSIRQVRDVRIEDLLRRDPIEFEGNHLGPYFAGRRILVSGAGGSIGAELCRQIAALEPAALVLLGHGENSIFLVQQELRALFPRTAIHAVIADVRDRARLEESFALYRPDVVFHSAAHKHVPLMEGNVAEAVNNNVFGTRAIAQVATRYGVRQFVFISSDKAVRPTSVMGVTKRVAELVVQDIAQSGGLIFTVVRFGNVLGSRGSLIPILQQQIVRGGPVTLTHADATRYFMTIPEAAKLVIHAATRAEGGDVFVLDMGEPVRIADLAHDLIELSGLRVGHDVEIQWIGLRPGEKLHEELAGPDEELAPTDVPKLLRLVPRPVNAVQLHRVLQDMQRHVESGDEERLRGLLQQLVPDYRWEPVALPVPRDEGQRTR
ncbi:MAG: polysaccharide biosynthesis protein [Chloroflexi bacterium]|nr:polysaccharide biosynthesis protein [Chloroflexota bacterium]